MRGFNQDSNTGFSESTKQSRERTRAMMSKPQLTRKNARENFLRPAFGGTIAEIGAIPERDNYDNVQQQR